LIVTAWNNGAHYYGLTVAPEDKGYFNRSHGKINLKLEGEAESIKVNIDKDSFWNNTCGELIKKQIGDWLTRNRLAPWKWRNPPKLCLEKTGKNEFLVHRTRLN